MQTQKHIGTHSGCFHLDEVLACVMLTKYTEEYKGAKIIRSRDLEMLSKLDILVDVGGIYDPKTSRYDHHQREFKGTFSQLHNITLSSAGLIYKHFGYEVLENIIKQELSKIKLKKELPAINQQSLEVVYQRLYDNFILCVDARDNGVNQYSSECQAVYADNTSLGFRIARLNPKWSEIADDFERFQEAMTIVEGELIGQVREICFSWLPAKIYVEQAVNDRLNVHQSGQIIRLVDPIAWKGHIYEVERQYNIEGLIKFVLYGDPQEGWRVQTVNLTSDSYESRNPLNEKWRGIKDQVELRQASGINDIVFVHATGFIGGAKSYESAVRMAVESLNA